LKKLGLVALLVALTLIVTPTIVQAQWPAINSGYAVTTNWHGIDVPLGASVTAWAGTTDSTVEKVEFIWKDADGNVVRDEMVTVDATLDKYTTPAVPPGAPPEIVDWAQKPMNWGITIWYAQDTYPSVTDPLGDWSVKAKFINAFGQTVSSESDSFPVRATSFNVVPEVSFGTIAILIAMFGALLASKRFHVKH